MVSPRQKDRPWRWRLLRQDATKIISPKQQAILLLLLLGLLGLYTLLFSRNNSLPPTLTTTTVRKQENARKSITVVLMNHGRPRNIQETSLLPTILEHELITEVLLLHSNPPTAFHYEHPKVRNINATLENAKMGLSLRFWFCGIEATNEWVILVDDDMLIPKQTFDSIIHEFAQNTHRIVGIFGRTFSYWMHQGIFANGYNTRRIKGASEVVLTKLMIMEKEICPYFHRYSHLMDDLVEDSVPFWNGEDIFMSLVANHVYANNKKKYPKETQSMAKRGKNNYAMPWLSFEDVDKVMPELHEAYGKGGISGNPRTIQFWNPQWWNKDSGFPHLRYRGTLWKKARERLANQPLLE